MQFKPALVFILLVVSAVPFTPGASAETVTKTWTQTSQIDFSQGSGDGDVASSPGSVLPGGGIPSDPSRWTVDQDAGCNWSYCQTRSYAGSPYVYPGQGSLYFGRGMNYVCCPSVDDRISIAAPNRDSVKLYLYASPGYYGYGWNPAYINTFLRVYDGIGNSQSTQLQQLYAYCCSGWSLNWFNYQAYETINGWGWYRYDIPVPSHFDKASLRVQIHQNTYGQNCWSSCQLYLFNYYAFAQPSTATFVSNVHDAQGLATWGSVNLDGYVPNGAQLKLQTRTSGDGVTFSEWQGALSGEPVQSPAGRFIQYRALFTKAPTGESPRLDEVRISYSFTVDTNPPRTAAQLVGNQGCAGWYVTRPYVVLTAQDDSSGVANTFASLDGGLFSAYGGPFQVGDGVHTVDFFSVDGAGNTESVRSLGFKVDSEGPNTALGLSGGSFASDRLYVRPGTTFTLDASDATSGVKATTVDTGAGASAYTGPFSLGGADGPRSVAFGSEDVACNLEGTQQVDVFVDGTAPTVSLLEPEAGSFNLDGRDSEDLPPYQQLRGQLQTVGLYGSDVDVVADILLGGASEVCGPVLAERCAALGLAQLAPRLGGAVVAGTVTVEADAADPAVNGGASGLAGVAFLVDGELRGVDTAAPFQFAWDTSGESLGRHVVQVMALDNLGNSATASASVTVLPLGKADSIAATGAMALDALGAPNFARELYAFAVGKVLGLDLPAPPPGPPTPDPAAVLAAILGQVPPLPPLPVEPPALPPVEPPGGVPNPPPLPPLPPVPQLCIGDVCTPVV